MLTKQKQAPITILTLPEPNSIVEFKPAIGSVRRNEIISMASALCKATEDYQIRQGIRLLAEACGVESTEYQPCVHCD